MTKEFVNQQVEWFARMMLRDIEMLIADLDTATGSLLRLRGAIEADEEKTGLEYAQKFSFTLYEFATAIQQAQEKITRFAGGNNNADN